VTADALDCPSIADILGDKLEDRFRQARMHTLNRLSYLKAARLKLPGIYEDGGGLRLMVGDSLAKRWVLRVTINGKRRERGLGSFPTVSLEEARERAGALRKAARQGRDLVAEERRLRANSGITFAVAFETYFEQKQHTLSNGKHVAQWRSTMQRYVLPKIGAAPVAEVDAEAILLVLAPIWFDKPETARRVLQRMEAVFRSAILRGHRKLASPCIGVAEELGTRHRRVSHHAALAWREVPVFVRQLRAREATLATRLALEFLILTVGRSGEVRGARWTELDLDACVWRVPAERMKARTPHIVPLSERCLEILAQARKMVSSTGLVFPSASGDNLSDMTFTKLLRDMGCGGRATAHGFRTSFKVWAAEAAKVRDEVSEAALAHRIPEKVRAAYLRTSFIEERAAIMQKWGEFVSST
jgi:integrase